LRLFSFGGYGLALAALALVVFGAYDSYPTNFIVCDFSPLAATDWRLRRWRLWFLAQSNAPPLILSKPFLLAPNTF